MATPQTWPAFLDEHAEVIGYDLGEVFVPCVDTPRDREIRRRAAAALGVPMGTPVLGWKQPTPDTDCPG